MKPINQNSFLLMTQLRGQYFYYLGNHPSQQLNSQLAEQLWNDLCLQFRNQLEDKLREI